MIWLIIIPFLAGGLVLLVPAGRKGVKEGISLSAAAAVFGLSVILFSRRPLQESLGGLALFRLDHLSALLAVATGLFGLLIVLYSRRYMAPHPRLREYYACLLFTLGGAFGVFLAEHMILLLAMWGLVGFTLYLLVNLGGAGAGAAAKKTFIIIGGSDALLLLGLAIIWRETGSWRMNEAPLPLQTAPAVVAFFCLAAAAFAKAGAMPFHTWIPACAESAPVPVTAFLPAALDKLLGIYLLVRTTMNIFSLTANSPLSLFLMAAGAIIILAAVMMALIQHDMKRLLSYHAVSQVGYMILGIGTGLPIGIAGGIFHMLNNALYKCCLFLTGGAVEFKRGTTKLDRLGGLARAMPLTYLAFFIAALAISGVPPLNGFFSKWMVYQGILEMGQAGGRAANLWWIWLLAAMFGSALTLASFMKLLHAVFLGEGGEGGGKDEVAWSMWLPMAILALFCVLLGVLAGVIPIGGFLRAAVPGLAPERGWPGWWEPGTATLLIVLGLAVGWIIYRLGDRKGWREDPAYIGGEKALPGECRVTGSDFYDTIREIGWLKTIFALAERQYFDIYEQGSRAVFFISDRLRSLHGGVLPVYLGWSMFGLIILLLIFLG